MSTPDDLGDPPNLDRLIELAGEEARGARAAEHELAARRVRQKRYAVMLYNRGRRNMNELEKLTGLSRRTLYAIPEIAVTRGTAATGYQTGNRTPRAPVPPSEAGPGT